MPLVAEAPIVNKFNPESPKVKKMLKFMNSNLLMRPYLLYKLPMAWFMGLRVKSIGLEKSSATIPFGWRTQNPFRSIYFIAQAGAAEFPAGLMATLAIQDRGCQISMLVRKVNCEFSKKANGKSTFTCEDGLLIQETVQKAIDTGEGQECEVTSTGRMANGEVVSVTKLTWSFKVKS